MNILFAANEVHPIYKLGGLGDVANSLPQALSQSHDIRIVIPHHPEIKIKSANIAEFSITYKHRKEKVSISFTYLPGTRIPIYLVKNTTYLSTTSDTSDNHADKYAFFSLAISTWVVKHTPHWQPDLIHLNDWHVALVPVILKHLFPSSHYATLLTIHNLAYQASTFTPVDQHLHLPPDSCDIINWDKQDMNLNILLEGILHSTATNTVSPTYAKEILTPEFSYGLDNVFSGSSKISGILNGLDLDDFNPATDSNLAFNYSSPTAIQGKQENKQELYKKLNLSYHPKQKLISFVGRVDSRQKGIEFIINAISQGSLPSESHQFVFLGVGEAEPSLQLHSSSKGNQNISINTVFDESLSRQIYAASDLTIIPSQYEPCGLVQMIAMRYGSLPIAHNVGGLKDTIIHQKDGFVFSPLSTETLSQAITNALKTIRNKEIHHKMIESAMSKDFSWKLSAKKYNELFQQITNLHE